MALSIVFALEKWSNRSCKFEDADQDEGYDWALTCPIL